jgi:hypothetical protein
VAGGESTGVTVVEVKLVVGGEVVGGEVVGGPNTVVEEPAKLVLVVLVVLLVLVVGGTA